MMVWMLVRELNSKPFQSFFIKNFIYAWIVNLTEKLLIFKFFSIMSINRNSKIIDEK